MKTKLRLKCKQCGNWNRIEFEKIFLNPDSREPKYTYSCFHNYHLRLKYVPSAKM